MKNIYAVLFASLVLFPAPVTHAQTYCMLPGRTPYATIQPGIIRFALNKVVRTSYNVESLSEVVVSTNLTDSLVRSQTYTVSITHTRDSVNFPTGTNNIRIYIDLNQDWDFTDAGETVLTANYKTAGTFTGTFTIPSTASLGITGMRVTAKMSQDVGHSAPTPCDVPADPIGYHGEIEDYWIDIAAEPNHVGINAQQVAGLNARIYPNPAKDALTIELPGAKPQAVSVTLLDLTGKKTACFLENGTVNGTLTLPLQTYDAGIYFLELSSGNSIWRQKLVIE